MSLRNAEFQVRAMKELSDRAQAALAKNDGSQELRQFHITASKLHAGADAFLKYARARSPRVTVSEHLLQVKKASDKYASETTAAINQASNLLNTAISASEARVRKKTNLVPNGMADELRGIFRTLTPQKQAEFLSQLIDEGRGPELAALVRVPGIYTGLIDKQRSDYEAAYISRHAPEELEFQAAINDAYEAVMVMTDTGYKIAKSFVDPAVITEIVQSDNAAAEAAKAFAEATMGGGGV